MKYRLKVKVGKQWRNGLVEYASIGEAVARKNELLKMKKCNIKIMDELGVEIK
jgi:hypothetical protein